MPLVLAGATSGSATLQATDATTTVLTLPATTGTLVTTGGAVTSAVSGNGVTASSTTGAVTFALACPTWGSVGSYATGVGTTTGGYSAGNWNAPTLLTVNTNYSAANAGISGGSGTWKCMGVSGSTEQIYTYPVGCGSAYGVGIYQYFYIFCRVS
jgi:hypothetical protein